MIRDLIANGSNSVSGYVLNHERQARTMSYTFDAATPDRIIGRVVGDQKEHIAFRIGTDSMGTDYLIAVSERNDPAQYVTWAYGFQNGHLAAFWGHYFDDYDLATEDFERRIAR